MSLREKKRVQTPREICKKTRIETRAKTSTNPNTEEHRLIIEDNLRNRIPHNRRIGRPKHNWTSETMKHLWEIIRTEKPEFQYQEYIHTNNQSQEAEEAFKGKANELIEEWDKFKENTHC